jgi:hypothetical protein
MKIIILFIFLTPCLGFTQLSGDIAEDGRKTTEEFNYEINSTKTGVLTFDIAVDNDGNVTGCTLNRAACTIYSTPLIIHQKNRILKELKFEKGSHYPEFHQGTVRIQVSAS